MGAVTIREADADDAEAIAEVHVVSWRWAYRGLLPGDLLDGLSVDEREQMWREAVAADPGSVLIAADGQDILGFASVGPSRDDDALPSTGELLSLYLVERAAGTGVGARLLTEAELALRKRGFDRASLWVLGTNARARRFYDRQGWTWDGTESTHQVQCANLPIVRYTKG